MDSYLQNIISKIEVLNPLHGKKLKKNLQGLEPDYFKRAALFFNKYEKFVHTLGRDLDYGIECYLTMLADVMYEQVRFLETGEYSSKSFQEVQQRVYSNPEVMEYYMHGLMISNFLWVHHYRMLSFFVDALPRYRKTTRRYLEIGGGHGLYLSEALAVLDGGTTFEVIDISERSLEISKLFVDSHKVRFMLSDIYAFEAGEKYDFITMGEVLEHVEEPVKLLERVHDLLTNQGHIFITVPINSPAIDHIYLFRSTQEIRNALNAAHLEIVEEQSLCAENVPEEKAEELRITILYGALLKKIHAR
jgi:2-polyprenyl-3-methyl-5-hydroxy-6-metoxy-1,4-benzoquinol methylase